MFNPVTTLLPTCLGSRQGDTDSTIDLAVSPRIAPRLSAKTLIPHGSDHLPVMLSLQKPAKKQNIKPHNPFGYERLGSDKVSKRHKWKARTQITKGSQKSKKQPPWWDSENKKSWTEIHATVKKKKKTSRKEEPDQTRQSKLQWTPKLSS